MFQIHKTPNFIASSSQVFTNFIKFLLFMCTLKYRSYSTVLDRSYNNNNSIGCKWVVFTVSVYCSVCFNTAFIAASVVLY